MKAFLDTNVLVSAVATRGLCADVLREVLASHQLVVSAPLFNELGRILRRKVGLPRELIREFREMLVEDSQFADSSPSVALGIRDKDDLPILSSALNGAADLFITGDKELLKLHKVGRMRIVSPRRFWEILRGEKTD